MSDLMRPQKTSAKSATNFRCRQVLPCIERGQMHEAAMGMWMGKYGLGGECSIGLVSLQNVKKIQRQFVPARSM